MSPSQPKDCPRWMFPVNNTRTRLVPWQSLSRRMPCLCIFSAHHCRCHAGQHGLVQLQTAARLFTLHVQQKRLYGAHSSALVCPRVLPYYCEHLQNRTLNIGESHASIFPEGGLSKHRLGGAIPESSSIFPFPSAGSPLFFPADTRGQALHNAARTRTETTLSIHVNPLCLRLPLPDHGLGWHVSAFLQALLAIVVSIAW